MKKVLKNILYLVIFFIGILINPAFAYTNSANVPIVPSGLTPIKWDGTKWVETEHMDVYWYDYEHGNWANAWTAAKENGPMYVWIPRFTYKIEDKKISIKWSAGKEDDIEDGYLRHPAFYFGEYFGGDTNNPENFSERNYDRNELTGFWIQKDIEDTTNAFEAFENSMKMTQNSAYGFAQSGTYTHMTKASEWGALSYLTMAKGKYMSKSTTANITGVNIGNKSEYVAGLYGSFASDVKILNSEYRKYRDVLDGNLNKYKGYALSETTQFTDEFEVPNNGEFLVRGGNNLELFGYTGGTETENNMGYRTSISVIKEELTDTISFFDTEASIVSGDYLILGVDFYVELPEGYKWKFPEDRLDLFEESDKINGKKVIDMECIYEGTAKWTQYDLNAEVIKMIKSDMSSVEASGITSSSKYGPGKYTLVVKVGGKIDEVSVFKCFDDMDVKIVVNELNLTSVAPDNTTETIKIDKITNNKVRLNVYGESASTTIDRVVLVKSPDKVDYEKGDELVVYDGIIVAYSGNLVTKDGIFLTLDNVVEKNITSQKREDYLVELVYKLKQNGVEKEIVVEQEDVQFRINVSDIEPLIVNGEIKVGETKINGQFTGPDEYPRFDTDYTADLITGKDLKAYMFKNWTSNSTIVKAANAKEVSTTFKVPKKTTTLDVEEVLITAHYVAPSGIEVREPKTEFYIGDKYTVGSGQIVVFYEIDNKTEEKLITLGTPGITVTLKDKLGNEVDINNLPEGYIDVYITYGGVEATYEIEVISSKHWLNVAMSTTEYGEINGTIKDTRDETKSTIAIKDEKSSFTEEVPVGRQINLTAQPSDEYVFVRWKVTGPENLIPADKLTSNEISFTMPPEDVSIQAEFSKEYTITFKVKSGLESKGSLTGKTVQKVLQGESTSQVIAVPSANCGFVKWVDSKNSLITRNEALVCTNVQADEEYTAIFDNVWTISFYNGDELFEKIEVLNGANGNINQKPTKDAHVFIGWDKKDELNQVTSNIVTYAEYVPRINVEDNGIEAGKLIELTEDGALKYRIPLATDNMIDAQITGTHIEEGTLQYIISSSPETPEDYYFMYKQDDIFTGVEGSWQHLNEYYRNPAVNVGEDSSSILTISSIFPTETVSFDYILSATSDSQLGITINGEKVIGPDQAMSDGWNSFEREIEVIDGEIKIGISYSQGSGNNTTNDFAAIRNLLVAKRWTVIPNEYHLFIPGEYEQNYIHLKGTGDDDLVTIYRAVAEVYNSTATN